MTDLRPLLSAALLWWLAASPLAANPAACDANGNPIHGQNAVQVGLRNTPFPYTSLLPALTPEQISALPALPNVGTHEVARREHVYITRALARILGIAPHDRGASTTVNPNWQGGNPQIRVSIEGQTFRNFWKRENNTNKFRERESNAIFTVVGVVPGQVDAIYLYEQLSSTDVDSGEYKLFATDTADSNGNRIRGVRQFSDGNGNGFLDGVEARVIITAPSKTTIYRPGELPVEDGIFCEPDSNGSLVEEITRTTDTRFGLLIPHGGAIETNTSDQIPVVVSVLEGLPNPIPVNIWNVRGSWGDDQTHLRLHASTMNSHEGWTWPGLRELISAPKFSPTHAFERTLALHGFTGATLDLIIGGGVPADEKCLVVDRVQDQLETDGFGREHVALVVLDAAFPNGLDIPDSADRTVARRDIDGDSPLNLANRLAARGGVQVEQSKGVRDVPALRVSVARGIAKALADLLTGTDATDACDAYEPEP